MNSGLTGALGTAPLQTVKVRLGSFQGRSHTQIPLAQDGALILGPPPDGTRIGGAKRGARAVDLQIDRGTAASRVSSGTNSFAAGSLGTASGLDSAVLNSSGIASGTSSFAFGGSASQGSTASGGNSGVMGRQHNISGADSFAVGFSNVGGGTQCFASGINAGPIYTGGFFHSSARYNTNSSGQSQFVLRTACRVSSGDTPVELFNGISLNQRLLISSGKQQSLLINIIGVKSDGSVTAQYLRKCCIKNVGGTTSLVGSVEAIGTDIAAGTSISITADDTNDALSIEVTGVAAETWRWTAVIEGAEIEYGT
jgi:hypothetical protein